MQVASQKLRNTNASLAQVAETVGYDSEAAFSIGNCCGPVAAQTRFVG
jgi:AraC-like DNA-binding protein